MCCPTRGLLGSQLPSGVIRKVRLFQPFVTSSQFWLASMFSKMVWPCASRAQPKRSVATCRKGSLWLARAYDRWWTISRVMDQVLVVMRSHMMTAMPMGSCFHKASCVCLSPFKNGREVDRLCFALDLDLQVMRVMFKNKLSGTGLFLTRLHCTLSVVACARGIGRNGCELCEHTQ